MNWLICKPYELPYQPKKTFVIIQGGITTKKCEFCKKKDCDQSLDNKTHQKILNRNKFFKNFIFFSFSFLLF